MPIYGLPDIFGNNPDYLKVNMPFYVYANNLKITFNSSPVFVSSIHITLTDGSGKLLQKDVDWVVDSSDIDTNAMSEAFIANANFADQLVHSISLKNTALLNKQLAITVQEFYKTIPGLSFDDSQPIELNPSLIKYLTAAVGALQQQVSRVISPVTPNKYTPQLLPFDLNGELDSNIVPDEKITVNTVAGSNVVKLSHGAYFADSLIIKVGSTILSKDTDYLAIVPSPLLKETTNKSGIFQYVLLTKEITGEIAVSYRAVGGDVRLKDVAGIVETMTGIQRFLTEQIFLTPESIPQTPAFRAIATRVNNLEENMRNLLSGNPTYGDATANVAVRRPIHAVDANFHWYTIATLYKVAGSNDIITTDQFKGRVFFPASKIALTFSVDVNLNQPRNPVSFTTTNLVFDPLYTLFSDVSANAPLYPMLRLVWNNTAQGFTGAMLQIGLPLANLSDIMVVEDMSTAESCWLMVKPTTPVGNASPDVSGPSDDGFVLPDGVTIWSKGASASLSRVYTPVFKDGYLAYSGSNVTINNLTDSASHAGLFNIVLPKYFVLDNIKSILVTISSNDGSTVYDIEIPLPYKTVSNGKKYGTMMFTDSTTIQMTMTASIMQDSNGNFSIDLRTSEQGGTPSDVIRYLRVKV